MPIFFQASKPNRFRKISTQNMVFVQNVNLKKIRKSRQNLCPSTAYIWKSTYDTTFKFVV